jgi:hypothetical protein
MQKSANVGFVRSRRMPRLWAICLVILVACLIASMVIAIVKLS